MSGLVNPDGTHEVSSFESKIMDIIHAPIVNALARHNVMGTGVSDVELNFIYEFDGVRKDICIKIKVK